MQHGPNIKFNLSQEVFFLSDGKVITGAVSKVTTETFIKDGMVVNNIICEIQDFYSYPQGQVFATKQELIESL